MRFEKSIGDGLVLFWKGELSQWFKHSMTIGDVVYNCCEQYMMAQKAKLFKDEETYLKIMGTTDCWEQQNLGRQVKNFNQEVWDANCDNIVFNANFAKFQDPRLKAVLMGFGKNVVIAEASPMDKVWGIGLGEDDPRALDRTQWIGKNRLGEALMRVQDTLFLEEMFKYD